MWVTDWTVRAACKGTDPDELFVQGAAQNRAKLICRGCPVRTECLADALDNGNEFGVWGGLTERERRALLRRRPDVTSWRELLERARGRYEGQEPESPSITAVAEFDVPSISSVAESEAPSISVVAEFVIFYAAEHDPLVKFLLRHGIKYHDAADAAQTAFVEALLQWENMRSPRAWLRRVATRSVRRLREFPVEDIPVRDQPLLPNNIEINEQTRRVTSAIAQLPPLQRAVMAWTFDGFSPAEIAEELGCAQEAVRQNLHRAREALKRILRREGREGR